MGQCHSEPETPQPNYTLLGSRKRTRSVRQNPPNTGMKSMLDSAEYLALRRCFSDFAIGISDPEWIALKLYSEGLIDQHERMKAGNKMHSVLERNQCLLSAVEQQILMCPTSKFRDFLDILHSEPSLQHLAMKLEEAYGFSTIQSDPTTHGNGMMCESGHSGENLPEKCTPEDNGMFQMSELEKETTHSKSVTPARQPPSQPPPVVPDTAVEKYAVFLKACYTQHECSSTKWPPLDAINYVNLAVISSEYANKKELLKFRQQTIRGSIDDILEWKAPIAMQDILKPNFRGCKPYPITQLLIEGAPGIGKSTFAWEVCQKWAHHELFYEYSLVVLLKFRDKRVHDAESISDLFYHPLTKLHSEIVDHICSSGGQGLLIILEGYDEAPASKRRMDTIFVRLFRGQELPNATVVLTTRPSASAELRQLCTSSHSRMIEVVGFGKKEIDQYIQCTFSDEQSLSAFNEYLSLYPHIHSCMYVPLNCAIVTHVYKTCTSTSTVVPKTMTQLYSSLIRSLLLRHLRDKQEYRDMYTSIHSFKDLPQPVHSQFRDICKLAYSAIMSAETELIFPDLPSDFDPLGLMQTCPELYVDSGASVSHNFLHFTIQEYLAAYYISQQSKDEQVAFMKEHIANKKLEVVLRFLAGFSLSELGKYLDEVVRRFASEDLQQYSQLKRWGETRSIKLQMLHWLFESQDPSAATSILGSESACFCHGALLPFDSYVLGYSIAHSSCDWKLELRHCKLESVETFINLQQNRSLLPSKGQIKQMVLWFPDPAALHFLVTNIPQILVFSHLTHLGMMNSKLMSVCKHLCEHRDLLQRLLYLNLRKCAIGRGGAVNLITYFSKFNTIRGLDLHCTGIGFEDCKALSEMLGSSKTIELLSIGSNKLAPDSIQLIVDGLCHSTSLQKLFMRYSNFSSENIFSLASVLKVNTRLTTLEIQFCNIQGRDSVFVAKALEANTATQLQTLKLSGNPIGSEGAADQFASMLCTNKSLAYLSLNGCSIESEGAVCLAGALEMNSTVKELDLSNNPIGSAGAVVFAGMLSTNQSLTELVMNSCNIEEEGALAFSRVLKRSQWLKSLSLRDDSVGVEGALDLIQSLQENMSVAKLWLSPRCVPPSFSTLDTVVKERLQFQ